MLCHAFQNVTRFNYVIGQRLRRNRYVAWPSVYFASRFCIVSRNGNETLAEEVSTEEQFSYLILHFYLNSCSSP